MCKAALYVGLDRCTAPQISDLFLGNDTSLIAFDTFKHNLCCVMLACQMILGITKSHNTAVPYLTGYFRVLTFTIGLRLTSQNACGLKFANMGLGGI